MLVPVEIPLLGDERHKNWAKIVENVDTSKTTGWAYDGPFVATGGIQDVPSGSVLLVYGERGSRSNPQIAAAVYTVNADATLSLEAEAKGKAWGPNPCATPVEKRLGIEAGPPDLSHLADETLVEELQLRGWKVERP